MRRLVPPRRAPRLVIPEVSILPRSRHTRRNALQWGACWCLVSLAVTVAAGCGPTSGRPVSNATNGPVRPSPTMAPTRTEVVIPLIPTNYADWQAADSAAPFPLRQPRNLPRGLKLVSLQSFELDLPGMPTEARIPNSIRASYLGDGARFVLDQFIISPSEPFDIRSTLPAKPPPATAEGTVTVGPATAFWMNGVVTSDRGMPGWDDSTTVLTWVHLGVGFRIESRDLSLDEITSIARSLYVP